MCVLCYFLLMDLQSATCIPQHTGGHPGHVVHGQPAVFRHLPAAGLEQQPGQEQLAHWPGQQEACRGPSSSRKRQATSQTAAKETTEKQQRGQRRHVWWWPGPSRCLLQGLRLWWDFGKIKVFFFCCFLFVSHFFANISLKHDSLSPFFGLPSLKRMYKHLLFFG